MSEGATILLMQREFDEFLRKHVLSWQKLTHL